MIQKPLVLALGQGFSTPGGQELYGKVKSIAEFHWFHKPLKDETWISTLRIFAKRHGLPLVLLTYGVNVGQIDKYLLAALVPGLRLICSSSAGYDNVDVKYCDEHDIWVSNTPNSVSDSTANCAIWLILSALRKFLAASDSARSGAFRSALGTGSMVDPDRLILGVVGLGRIGSLVAKRLATFGMHILYHSRHRADSTTEKDSGGAHYVESLTELVSRSDVVSVHVPLSSGTTYLFDAAMFAKFKKGSIFVNTARGRIHDEQALIEALRSGPLAFAALDVFEDEPTISPEILQSGDLASSVVITPHIGAFTEQAKKKMEIELLDNIKSFLENDRPKYPVNTPEHDD